MAKPDPGLKYTSPEEAQRILDDYENVEINQNLINTRFYDHHWNILQVSIFFRKELFTKKLLTSKLVIKELVNAIDRVR